MTSSIARATGNFRAGQSSFSRRGSARMHFQRESPQGKLVVRDRESRRVAIRRSSSTLVTGLARRFGGDGRQIGFRLDWARIFSAQRTRDVSYKCTTSTMDRRLLARVERCSVGMLAAPVSATPRCRRKMQRHPHSQRSHRFRRPHAATLLQRHHDSALRFDTGAVYCLNRVRPVAFAHDDLHHQLRHA